MKDSDTTTTQQCPSKNRRALFADGRLNRHAQTVSTGGRNAILAVTIMATVILTGCTGGQGKPAPSEGVSSSQTSTAETATATAEPSAIPQPAYKPATDQGPAENVPIPVMPEKAKEFSKEGLIAFSEYWYETLSYVYETGDSNPMMAISNPSCETCAFVNEPLGVLYKEGGWIVGGQMNVYESSSQFVPADDGTYTAMLMIQQTKVTAYTADRTITNDYPQRRARANIVVASYTDQKWQARTAEPMTAN